jgi:hypothetical protein
VNADSKAIIGKLLLKPLDWLTLSPFVVGATLGMGAWAVNLDSGVATAASVILMLASAGIYLQRLILGWEGNYEEAVNEWVDSIEGKREKELDLLYTELAQDGDPRTENLLKDLRTLTKALMSERSGAMALNSLDIVADVDKLFRKSVDYLRETLDLWRMAGEMERKTIKEQLLQHREMLIGEVEKSLENLGAVLGSMKKAAVNSRDGNQLAELREDLASRLRIAEEVERKMQDLRYARDNDEEEYLRYADKCRTH